MKLILKVHIPSPAEIVAGLDVNEDPAVVAARERVDQAKNDRQHAEERVSKALADVARLRSEISRGEATTADLEAALVAHHAAVLSAPAFRNAVETAETALSAEMNAAKARVVREATKRRDALQRVADDVTPVLNGLRGAEEALDVVVQPCGLKYGVPPLDWPSTLEGDGARIASLLVGAGAFRPPAA